MRDGKTVVLLSTYNGEKYLAEQLESVLEQENVSVLINVRDDGSQDKTWEILESFAEKFKNIRIEKGENIGYGKSFWKLMQEAVLASGEIRHSASIRNRHFSSIDNSQRINGFFD